RRWRGLLCVTVAAAGVGGMAPRAGAAINTWTGGSATGNNWSDPANWGGTAPANNGTAAIVFAGSTRILPNIDTAFSVLSVTFNGGTSLMSQTGSNLTIGSGGITNNSSAVQDFGNAFVILGTSQTWNAASGPI
ncbi:MAG TPA: hypothetical protein VLI90_12030, partial [Tepidisphaeraceae bacterium]|nr:hypothetical protein [Tepidisphaeraceae bacterium]